MTDLTIPQAKDLLRARFLSLWTAAGYSAANIEWPNDESFTKPDSGDETSLWARWTEIHNPSASGQISLGPAGSGTTRFRRRGIFIVQLFVPGKSRTTAIDTATEALVAGFEGVTISGIWVRNTSSNEVGADPPWYQVNVSGEFTYEKLR